MPRERKSIQDVVIKRHRGSGGGRVSASPHKPVLSQEEIRHRINSVIGREEKEHVEAKKSAGSDLSNQINNNFPSDRKESNFDSTDQRENIRTLHEISRSGESEVEPRGGGNNFVDDFSATSPRYRLDDSHFLKELSRGDGRVGGSEKKHSMKKIINFGALIVLLIVFGGYLWGTFLGKVTLDVFPKQKKVVMETTITASAKDGTITFVPISANHSESKVLPKSGTKKIDKKASGNIIIYNNYSSSPQKLVKNTRFETTDGKIYRIDKTVTVPGLTKSGGKDVPGSISATVYADGPGESYNIPPTDFTVPGFKGTPRYEKFYARSQSPIAGGFSGEVAVVSEAVIETAFQELSQNLKNSALGKIRDNLSAGVIIFPSLTTLMITDNRETIGDDATFTVTGTLTAFGFDEMALSSELAKRNMNGYDDSPIRIANLKELLVNPAPKLLLTQEMTDITMTISGTAHFVYVPDLAILASALSGKKREEIPLVLQNFPAVEKIQPHFSPFWTTYRSFGENQKDLFLVEKLSE